MKSKIIIIGVIVMKNFLTVLLINLLVMWTSLCMEFRQLVWHHPKKLPMLLQDQLDAARKTGKLDFGFAIDLDQIPPFDPDVLAKKIKNMPMIYAVVLGGWMGGLSKEDKNTIIQAVATLPGLRSLDYNRIVAEGPRIYPRLSKIKIYGFLLHSWTKYITSLQISERHKPLSLSETERIQRMCSLRELSLHNTDLYEADENWWNRLGPVLQQVTKLDLSNNRLFNAKQWLARPYGDYAPCVSTTNHHALAQTLMLSNVQELDMSKNFQNTIVEYQPSVKIFAKALAFMPKLKKLYLDYYDCNKLFFQEIMRGLLLNRNKPVLVVRRGLEVTTIVPDDFAPEILSNSFILK